MSNVEQLRNQIIKNLQTLKREIDRLSVREAALLRCRRLIVSSTPEDPTDEEEELQAEVIANIEAIEYDLTTFKSQIVERLAHAERGLRLGLLESDTKKAELLYQYVLDGAVLCVNDAATARVGYDELISGVNELTHSRDV